MLHVDVDTDGEISVVRPQGEIDANTVGAFRDALSTLPGVQHLIIDLAEVPFLDSAGLGALIGVIRRVREADGDVAIAGPRPPLRRILLTTGLDRIVAVEDSVEAALAWARACGWENEP